MSQGEDSPEAVNAALVLGRVAYERGQLGAAEGWAKSAIVGLERMSARAGAAPADLQPALGLLATLMKARGDAEQAARLFERAGEVARRHPLLGPAAYLDEAYNAALAWCQAGAWHQARDGLERALREAPADVIRTTRGGVAVRGQLGIVRTSLGERGAAEELLATAIRDAAAVEDAAELVPDFVEALAALRR